MTTGMADGDFPRRGRKFCPVCDAAMLTVRQLEAHIAECPERVTTKSAAASARSGVTHRARAGRRALERAPGIEPSSDDGGTV